MIAQQLLGAVPTLLEGIFEIALLLFELLRTILIHCWSVLQALLLWLQSALDLGPVDSTVYVCIFGFIVIVCIFALPLPGFACVLLLLLILIWWLLRLLLVLHLIESSVH